MQEASDAHSKTADSDTVSTYQVSSVQLVTEKKPEALLCSTIVLAVARLSAPATTATHSRVIRLRRVHLHCYYSFKES